MSEIICPLCGKANPAELDECQYCQAPLKTGGFLAPGEEEINPIPPSSEDAGKVKERADEPKSTSNLEASIPDWLKETEASFLEPSEPSLEEAETSLSAPSKQSPGESEADQFSKQLDALINPPPVEPKAEENAIDEDWLASLLAEAGAIESAQPEQPQKEPKGEEPELFTGEILSEAEQEAPAIPTLPSEKPDWLTNLEASSNIKLEGGIFTGEPEQIPQVPPEIPEEQEPEPTEQPDWLTRAGLAELVESPKEPEIPREKEGEVPIAPAELPGWLEAIRPVDAVSPTKPVEDVSSAEIVTAGPLTGLRGVISAHPSAIRAQKPPTYSIKLKVTDEQQARLQMMEELLADEEKPKPLPAKPAITSRHIIRLIVAIVLLLPILWMIIGSSRRSSTPQPGNVPGVVDFTQRIQALPANVPVLIAFDYEAGFSGELNITVTNVLIQLMKKNAYIALVATTPSGPALAESTITSASSNIAGSTTIYPNYADLGYIPGGTLGLMGLATSPKNILPYSLNGSNVWTEAPLNTISTVKDFSAVIVITNDPDTARIWIEQVGTQLQEAGTPLLFITSAQAEPLMRPYFQATPAQIQGMIAGLAGGVAYARAVGNYQQNGTWDAYSAGVTISILIVLIGSISGVVIKMLAIDKKKEA